jgi:hypothetical protein
MAEPDPPRVLGAGGKLVLAVLSSALGGVGGVLLAGIGAMLLQGAGDAAVTIGIAACGLCGAGVCVLSLSKTHLHTGWRDTASQMYAWFGAVALVAVGAEGAITGVLWWRHLILPESAPFVTGMLFFGPPALGGLGAVASSFVLLRGRGPA